MKQPSAKKRTAARPFRIEILEARSLLSTVADGTLAAPAASPADGGAAPAVIEHIALTPNDPEYTDGDLWGLNGTYGVNAPGAWDVTTGSPATVTIADIDTGADYDHPDLYQNIWINQAEIPASRMANLVDVYHDGYISWRDLNNPVNIGPGKITDVNGDGVIDAADILSPMILNVQGQDTGQGGWANPTNTQDGDTAHPDDLIGWNFVNNTNNPLDDNGHGTHTAGIMAASGNNGVGVVGVDWTAQVMVLKFLDNTGSGTDTAAAEAIDYAAQHGAKVANASWGDTSDSPAVDSAISYAGSKGMVFVAAAGNNGADTDSTPFYPADSGLPNVISVGAIQSDGTKPGFSDYGSQTVDLSAPGVNIESTLPNGRYGYLTGTSMAAPFVTGTAALVEGLHPSWSVSEVINQIETTTTPDPSLAGDSMTGGIVNAAQAVIAPSTGASFVGTDATTQGNWRGSYGGDGYDIPADTSGTDPVLPPYAQVSVIGAGPAAWTTSTTDPRALQDAANTGRIASAWFSGTSMTFSVDMTDGQAHRAGDLRFGLGRLRRRPERARRRPRRRHRQHPRQPDDRLVRPGRVPVVERHRARPHPRDQPQPQQQRRRQRFVPRGAAAPSATASFLGTDSTTQGSWRSSYGGDGYDIPADQSGANPDLPAYAQVVVAGATPAAWTTSTADPRALQDAADTGQIASGWFTGSTMTFDVNLTDGQPHELAIYALDWDGYGGGRSERIDVLDAASGAVLSTQTIASFGQGEYLSWTVTGHVKVVVTNLNADSNAVVNGLFFGNGVTSSGAASFLGTDTATQGSWRSSYGGDGYDIPADQSGANPDLPAYAQVVVAGATPAAWTTSTTDPRALQDAANSGRISSAWFGSTITLDVNLTDGQAHRAGDLRFGLGRLRRRPERARRCARRRLGRRAEHADDLRVRAGRVPVLGPLRPRPHPRDQPQPQQQRRRQRPVPRGGAAGLISGVRQGRGDMPDRGGIARDCRGRPWRRASGRDIRGIDSGSRSRPSREDLDP